MTSHYIYRLHESLAWSDQNVKNVMYVFSFHLILLICFLAIQERYVSSVVNINL